MPGVIRWGRRRGDRERRSILSVPDAARRPPLGVEFVEAMGLPLAQRRERFDELDLPEPSGELAAALTQLETPMPRRFRSAIEAWIDTATGIEARLKDHGVDAEPTYVVGMTVHHAKWGECIIISMVSGARPAATVDFGELGQKKVLLDFLTSSTPIDRT
jgi:hypothetical protein